MMSGCVSDPDAALVSARCLTVSNGAPGMPPREAYMTRRRAARPVLQIDVSFETTRFSHQHLIDVYTSLVPVIRRRHESMARPASGPKVKAAVTRKRGGGHD